MSVFLYGAAFIGLFLLICGAALTCVATNPPTAYLGTIGAGIGVALLAVQGFGRLLGV